MYCDESGVSKICFGKGGGYQLIVWSSFPGKLQIYENEPGWIGELLARSLLDLLMFKYFFPDYNELHYAIV